MSEHPDEGWLGDPEAPAHPPGADAGDQQDPGDRDEGDQE
jgi:hypothetical protein